MQNSSNGTFRTLDEQLQLNCPTLSRKFFIGGFNMVPHNIFLLSDLFRYFLHLFSITLGQKVLIYLTVHLNSNTTNTFNNVFTRGKSCAVENVVWVPSVVQPFSTPLSVWFSEIGCSSYWTQGQFTHSANDVALSLKSECCWLIIQF